jgi:hypothetical protein
MTASARRGSAATGRLEHNSVLQWLGRFGDFAYGFVHVILAVLVLRVAFGGSSSELDQRGAVSTIAAAPFGGVLLWVVAIGLFAFGVWQVLTAAVGFQWITDKGKRTRRRFGAVGRAVAACAVGVLALRLVLSAPTQSESGRQQDWTAQVLQLPGGRILVVVVGLVVLAGAATMGYRGVKQTFLDDLNPQRLRGKTRRWVGRLGTAGFVAKAAAFAIVGILVVIAGITVDPARSGGLDVALHTLAAQPFGDALLVLIALGLIAYGCYLAAEARYRRE